VSNLVSVGQILQSPEEYSGWLYLPDPPWSLDTQGIFAVDDKDADPADDPLRRSTIGRKCSIAHLSKMSSPTPKPKLVTQRNGSYSMHSCITSRTTHS